MLASKGYWAHFIVPDITGSQPFDVIAVKDGRALAIDCKTCVAKTFSNKRLEFNQIFSFEKWIKAGNEMPLVAVKHQEKIYWIPYSAIQFGEVIKLEGCGFDETQI